MELDKILERFAIISNLSAEESQKWSPLCEEAWLEITSNLKDGVNQEENARRLNSASAALAFYRYILYSTSNSGGAESFAAGELRIKTDTSRMINNAKKVWQDAKRSIADILKDENFMFERII